MTTTRSGWREPMVWLMLGLPLASVFAGVSLVVTAVRSGGADEVRDEVSRTGQIQVAELGPDARARSLDLSAVVRISRQSIEILPVSGDFDRSQALQLVLAHPSASAQDVVLQLKPTELGWRTASTTDARHDWLIELAPTDHTWRLRGRLVAGQRAVLLSPALSGAGG